MSPVYKLKLWSQENLSVACKKGGKKPNWTQNFSFPKKKLTNLLTIEIWDENKYEEKDLIGSNYISLDNYKILNNNNKFSDWFDILYENKKTGKVFISFQYSE